MMYPNSSPDTGLPLPSTWLSSLNSPAAALSVDMPQLLGSVYTSTTYTAIAQMAYTLAAYRPYCAQPVT